MPRIVTKIPERARSRTKSSQYDRFFDGRIWEVEPKDFPHTSLVTLRATLIRRALRKKLTLVTALRHDPERLFIHLKTGKKESA